MISRPILMNAPMVRGTIERRKRKTRRTISELTRIGYPMHEIQFGCDEYFTTTGGLSFGWKFPYGETGDRLWVRETHIRRGDRAIYRADFDPVEAAGIRGMYGSWKPGIHMFRKHSRILLEITDVQVERLQEITEEDCIAEGIVWRDGFRPYGFTHRADGDVTQGPIEHFETAKEAFRKLWESINGPGSWDANPWVWVVSFEVLA